MTTGFGSMHVELTADATKFSAQLKNADGALRSSQTRMNRSLAAMEKSFKGLAAPLKNVMGQVFSLRSAFAALAGVGGLAGLGVMTRRAIDTADAIAKMADRIGISTDALQQLSYVASQAGLPIEQMEVGLRKLNNVLADQAAGKKTVLQQVGIDAKDAAGKVRPLEEVLLDLADVFQKIGPQSAAGIRVLTLALGERSGTAFASALKDGSASVRQLMDDAKRLGLVLEQDLLRGAESAGDALDRMKDIVGANLTRLLLNLAPIIENVAQAFADGAPHIERWTNAIIRAIFGVDALGTRGLQSEIESINDEIAALDKRIADRTRIRQKIPSQELEQRADLVKRLLQAEQLLEDSQRREEARNRLPSGGGGALPPGMNEAAATNKMREYLEGLRQSVVLAQAETKERAVLEATIRAEALAREDAAKGLRKSAELSEAERDSIRAYVELQQEATDKEAARKEAMAEGKAMTESLLTPAEAYAESLRRINELLAQGAINEITAARAREEAKKTFETADEGAKQAKAASDQLAISFKSAFEEAVAGGKSIDEIFEALIQDIIKMILQLYILKPLLDAIAKSMNSILGGGGGFSFGAIFGSSGGGAQGIAGSAGSYLGFASGGSFMVGGSGGTDSQLVQFMATPNERVDVTTPGQQRGMGGDMIVNVINKTDGKARTEESTGPNGEKMIEVIIERALRRPGSGVNKAMTDTFGARTQLATRG